MGPGQSRVVCPTALDLQIPTTVLAPVAPQYSLGTARLTVLTHSHPAAVSRVTLSVPDLGPQCMSAKALGKQELLLRAVQLC